MVFKYFSLAKFQFMHLLPREPVDSPSLQVFKPDVALDDQAGVRSRDLPSAFPNDLTGD